MDAQPFAEEDFNPILCSRRPTEKEMFPSEPGHTASSRDEPFSLPLLTLGRAQQSGIMRGEVKMRGRASTRPQTPRSEREDAVNLVNELQVSAESDDVLTVLRKTKRLASKLDRQDIGEWLESEQDGYAAKQTIPTYRTVGVSLAYNTNGYIPAGWGMMVKGTEMLPDCGLGLKFGIPDSISTILSWLDGETRGEGLCSSVPAGSDLCRKLRTIYRFDPHVAGQITFLFRYNGAEIRAIPDRIKDKVLDWALCSGASRGDGRGDDVLREGQGDRPDGHV